MKILNKWQFIACLLLVLNLCSTNLIAQLDLHPDPDNVDIPSNLVTDWKSVNHNMPDLELVPGGGDPNFPGLDAVICVNVLDIAPYTIRLVSDGWGGQTLSFNFNENDLQAGLDSASTTNSNEIVQVFFPSGNYSINMNSDPQDRHVIEIPNRMVLKGDGAGKTNILWTGNIRNKTDLFFVGQPNAANNQHLSGIECMRIDASGLDMPRSPMKIQEFHDIDDILTVDEDFNVIFPDEIAGNDGSLSKIRLLINTLGNLNNLDYNIEEVTVEVENDRIVTRIQIGQFEQPIIIESFLPYSQSKIQEMLNLIDMCSNKSIVNFGSNASYSWMKNVHSYMGLGAHVMLNRCNNVTIHGCLIEANWIHGNLGNGTAGYGIVFAGDPITTDVDGVINNMNTGQGAEFCLIENNIIKRNRHSIVVQDFAQSNVIAYNFTEDSWGVNSSPEFDLGGPAITDFIASLPINFNINIASNAVISPIPFITSDKIVDVNGEFEMMYRGIDIVVHGDFPEKNLLEGNSSKHILVDNVGSSDVFDFDGLSTDNQDHYLYRNKTFSIGVQKDDNFMNLPLIFQSPVLIGLLQSANVPVGFNGTISFISQSLNLPCNTLNDEQRFVANLSDVYLIDGENHEIVSNGFPANTMNPNAGSLARGNSCNCQGTPFNIPGNGGTNINLFLAEDMNCVDNDDSPLSSGNSNLLGRTCYLDLNLSNPSTSIPSWWDNSSFPSFGMDANGDVLEGAIPAETRANAQQPFDLESNFCSVEEECELPETPIPMTVFVKSSHCYGQDEGLIVFEIFHGTAPFNWAVTSSTGVTSSILTSTLTTREFSTFGTGMMTATVTDANGVTSTVQWGVGGCFTGAARVAPNSGNTGNAMAKTEDLEKTNASTDLMEENLGKFTAKVSPNPFSQRTNIEYELPTTGEVTVSITNTLGQPVRTLLNKQEQSAGKNRLYFYRKGLPAGLYFCTIQFNNEVKTIKLLIQ